jgi:hypothetical protein
MTTQPRIYWYTLLGLAVVYGWLSLQFSTWGQERHLQVCLVKKITGLPCPSCGTTRGVIALLHGQVQTALWLNPLSTVALLAITGATLLLLADTLQPGRNRLGQAWNRIETTLRRPPVMIAFALLIAGNWIWNMIKAL